MKISMERKVTKFSSGDKDNGKITITRPELAQFIGKKVNVTLEVTEIITETPEATITEKVK